MATIFVTWKNMQLQYNCIEFVTVDPEMATQRLSMQNPQHHVYYKGCLGNHTYVIL